MKLLSATRGAVNYNQLLQLVYGARFAAIVDGQLELPCNEKTNNCDYLTKVLQMIPITGHGAVSPDDADTLPEFTIEPNPRPASA